MIPFRPSFLCSVSFSVPAQRFQLCDGVMHSILIWMKEKNLYVILFVYQEQADDQSWNLTISR